MFGAAPPMENYIAAGLRIPNPRSEVLSLQGKLQPRAACCRAQMRRRICCGSARGSLMLGKLRRSQAILGRKNMAGGRRRDLTAWYLKAIEAKDIYLMQGSVAKKIARIARAIQESNPSATHSGTQCIGYPALRSPPRSWTRCRRSMAARQSRALSQSPGCRHRAGCRAAVRTDLRC